MGNTIVKYGQSIFDIAMQQYGDLSAVWNLIDDNQLTLDTDFEGAETITISTGITNTISQFFGLTNLIVNNSDLDVIGDVVAELAIALTQIANENLGGDGFIFIDVSGGYTPYQFQWVNMDTNEVLSTSQNLVGASAGSYQITVTDANNQNIQLKYLVIGITDNSKYLTDEFGNNIVDGNGNPITI